MNDTDEAPRPEAIESESQSGTDTKAEQLPEVLTVDEVARLLRVNRKTVYQAIQRKEFPCARHIGAAIRISRDAVLAWIAGQERVSLPTKGGAR